MRRIKSFFGNQTFFGKNYKIFAIISSKSDIWQKMHVPCKNILDGQSLTAPCGRAAHHAQTAARRIQLDVPAGAAPGHGVVGKGQAAGAVRIGISQRQPAVKGQREVARRGWQSGQSRRPRPALRRPAGPQRPRRQAAFSAPRDSTRGTSFFKLCCRAFINRYLTIILGSLCEGAVRGAD